MDNRKRMVSRGLTYEEKLMRRKMNNRISAQVARDRKKIFIKELENKVLALENEKKLLAEENYKLYQIMSTIKLQKKLNQLSHSHMNDKSLSNLDQLASSNIVPDLEVEVNSENTKINYNDLIHRSLPSPPHSPIKVEYQVDNVQLSGNTLSQNNIAVDNTNLSCIHLHHSFKNPAEGNYDAKEKDKITNLQQNQKESFPFYDNVNVDHVSSDIKWGPCINNIAYPTSTSDCQQNNRDYIIDEFDSSGLDEDSDTSISSLFAPTYRRHELSPTSQEQELNCVVALPKQLQDHIYCVTHKLNSNDNTFVINNEFHFNQTIETIFEENYQLFLEHIESDNTTDNNLNIDFLQDLLV